MTTSDNWAHNLLRSKNQLRHKTGVSGPEELLNPIQHPLEGRLSSREPRRQRCGRH